VQEQNINFESEYLNDIANQWLSDKEVQHELKDHYQLDVSSEATAEIQLFNFFGLKSGLKALFTAQSSTSEVIKQQIRKEPMKLIGQFNQVLADLRNHLSRAGLAEDVLFIIDGSEKLHEEVNRKLFISDAHIIKEINANMIIAVPIYSWFDIRNNPIQNFTYSEILPMIRLGNEKVAEEFARIITSRIDFDTFFDNQNDLDELVSYSGGSPQQLIRLVNTALTFSYGQTITSDIVEKTINETGRRMYETLTSEHIDVIKAGHYENADEPTLDLLFWLAILKYNGDRELNPLLRRFFSDGTSAD
jgi:hypothetical protein